MTPIATPVRQSPAMVPVMARPYVAVGPYEYTKTDARRTLQALAEIYSHHAWNSTDAARNTDLRERLGSLAQMLDPTISDPADSLNQVAHHLDKNFASYAPDTLARFLESLWPILRTADGSRLTGTGSVHTLQANGGGVPKPQINHATITFTGVDGDVQASRNHHGRPWQALCIWSREVIDAFRTNGDPITYGSAGENITVQDLNWALAQPGMTLRIGEVVCQITAFAIPCSQNKAWFADGDYRKMSHERGDTSRLYAMVHTPGVIKPGDEVQLFG